MSSMQRSLLLLSVSSLLAALVAPGCQDGDGTSVDIGGAAMSIPPLGVSFSITYASNCEWGPDGPDKDSGPDLISKKPAGGCGKGNCGWCGFSISTSALTISDPGEPSTGTAEILEGSLRLTFDAVPLEVLADGGATIDEPIQVSGDAVQLAGYASIEIPPQLAPLEPGVDGEMRVVTLGFNGVPLGAAFALPRVPGEMSFKYSDSPDDHACGHFGWYACSLGLGPFGNAATMMMGMLDPGLLRVELASDNPELTANGGLVVSEPIHLDDATLQALGIPSGVIPPQLSPLEPDESGELRVLSLVVQP